MGECRVGYYKPRRHILVGRGMVISKDPKWEPVTVENIACDFCELQFENELKKRGLLIKKPHRGDQCPWRRSDVICTVQKIQFNCRFYPNISNDILFDQIIHLLYCSLYFEVVDEDLFNKWYD